MVFPKKIDLELLGHFGPKNYASLQLWICCKDFFTMKETKVHMEVMLMDFLKPRILNNSRSSLRTSLKFCTMKETKRHFKIILMGLFKKIYFRQMWRFEPKNCTLNFTQNKGQRGTPKSS